MSEFDFWDFVECSKCHLPFITDSGPAIPFWLTDCGHIICNSHLSQSKRVVQQISNSMISDPDQSCHCGSTDIQVIPLQHDASRVELLSRF